MVNTGKFERVHDVAGLDDVSPISLLIPSGLTREGGETLSGNLEERVQSVKLHELVLEILSTPLIQLHIVRPIPELHRKWRVRDQFVRVSVRLSGR